MTSQDRYAAQMRDPRVGADGQRRLGAARVVVIGVGATGGAIAESLVRSGVGQRDLGGWVRVVDRDVPELGNLHRQVLFDEEDVGAGLPKAECARRRLARINTDTEIQARVADLDADNANQLLDGAHLVLDGTDNFAARFVINDLCAELGLPWIYAGVVGTTVHGFPVLPGGPCFRCYLPSPPPPGSVATCETAGVLGPAVLVTAGLAACEALKLLLGHADAAVRGLHTVDVWTREARTLELLPDPDCRTCAGERPALELTEAEPAEVLCGQDAVLLRAAAGTRLDTEELARRLAKAGRVEVRNDFLLRFAPAGGELSLTVFADGRAIVKGTQELALARSIYARYVGA